MNSQEGGAPAWLFSFVDLAFLMLIAMTQLAGDVGAQAPNLGEMIVPSIDEQGVPGELAGEASHSWQLRIHPRSTPTENPFLLISPGDDAPDAQESARLARESLVAQLDRLLTEGGSKPLLVPHEDSRSQDLLDAVSLLEERWPSRRRTLVARLSEP